MWSSLTLMCLHKKAPEAFEYETVETTVYAGN